jgi:hypothetical protein
LAFAQLATLEEGSSIWTSPIHGRSYLAANGTLYRVRVEPFSLTPIGLLDSSGDTSFADLLDKVVVTTMAGCFTVNDADVLKPLGIDPPGPPGVFVEASGGLDAGRYAFAASFLRGTEESGLSFGQFVDIPAGGGALLNVHQPLDSTVTGVNIYRTTPNGDVFYLAATLPVGTTEYKLGVGRLGRQSDTIYKTRIRGGHLVRHWRGRLLVARGRVLHFTEPMRYGVCDEREGFVQYSSKITLIEPVDTGVFVGSADGVIFLDGDGPGKWVVRKVSSHAPVFGTGVAVDASEINEKVAEAGGNKGVALWQTEYGYAVGLSSGTVVMPQAPRLKLSPTKVGAVMVHQRRIISTEIE